MSPRDFAVVLPAKSLVTAKSRLSTRDPTRRRALAEAFVRDVLAAALTAPSVGAVLVVTDDHRLAASVRGEQTTVVPDGVSGDLNATLRQAAAEARRRWPDLRPAALCADLPALDGAALEEVFALVREHAGDRAAFVADRAGTGTTFYSAPHGAFAPQFGARSSEAHLASGALALDVRSPRLRRDVDDVADLAEALALGVGAHTARAACGA